jgi:hypothetical protein
MSANPPLLLHDPLSVLEAICIELELTETQRQRAEQSYQTIGEWLNDENSPLAIYVPAIYPQGSILLGTTVRPINRADFDVDLICHLSVRYGVTPDVVYGWIEARLKAHGVYKDKIQRMNRCLRIDYQPDYHLDVTPAIPNPLLPGTQVLVPDRELKSFKDSNPKGYAQWFLAIAEKRPQILQMFVAANVKEAKVEPLPKDSSFGKKPLQRIVQILKRHRDIYFEHKQDRAVISVIITTLTALSYERALGAGAFGSMQEFVRNVVLGIPGGIQSVAVAGRSGWWLPNPSNPRENFAEKWNSRPERKLAFDAWHQAVIRDLDTIFKMPEGSGLSKLLEKVETIFGNEVTRASIRKHGGRILEAQNLGQLAVVGLGSKLSIGTPTKLMPSTVRPNTYFGR